MKTKFYILLAFVAIAIILVLIIAWPLNFKVVSKPLDFCAAPYNWAACDDWTFTGLRLTWGAEKDDKFIDVLNNEDWNMIWNGSTYDRHIRKTYMIQSSLLGDINYGDCGGWRGICYKYSDHNDIFKP